MTDYARLRALAEAIQKDNPHAVRTAVEEIDPEALLALLDRLEAATAYVADPGNWSALDGRRRLLLAVLNGEDPR